MVDENKQPFKISNKLFIELAIFLQLIFIIFIYYLLTKLIFFIRIL
jgi:hypothetical protein